LSLEELENTIKSEIGVLLYFSGENCNVCHALRPKFKDLFNSKISKDKSRYILMHIKSKISVTLEYSVFRRY